MTNPTVTSTPLVGQVLGHYRIVEKIGAGGMGEVFRARDEHLNRDVAIKVLPPGTLSDESARKRFRKEALALSRLNHPNIATVHDFDTEQGIDFLVMEYISGSTLSDRVASGPLPEAAVVEFGKQIAEGLAAAHEQDVVHCDLKPGNIRVTPAGRIKILDFGLAQLVRPITADATTETLSLSKVMGGTLPYMPREQLLGETIDARTDIYAFGAVLYEMATGRRLFPQSSTPKLVDATLHDTPTRPRKLNSALSPAFEAIVLKALQKEREHRYCSAPEMLRDLERLSGPVPDTTLNWRTESASRLWRYFPRRRRILTGFATLLCALAVALWTSRSAPVLAFEARDYILISDLENQTGDPMFDRSLVTALATSLDQSTHANVYSRARVNETLKRMQKPNVDHIDETLAEEIAEREGIKAIVVPTISNIGDTYQISARLRAVASGKDLRTEVARANGKAKILDSIDQLSTALRRDIGESRQEISKSSRPLATVTTQSLEALKQFSTGLDKQRLVQHEEAKTYFENALRIDPQFTAAQAALGMLHLDQSAIGMPHFDVNEGKRLLGEAVQHVSNLTDKEKYGILAFHALWVLNDPDKAAQYFKTLLGIYPECPATYNNLAWVYSRSGRFDQAITAGRKAISLDPHLLIAYSNVAMTYQYQLGDVKSALDICQQALQVDPQNAWASDCVGWSYFGKRQWSQAQAAFEKAVAFNPNSTLYRFRLAHAHRLQGHYQQAIQALKPIQKIDPTETSVWYDLAMLNRLMGKEPEARQNFEHYRQLMETDLKKNPKNLESMYSLAETLLRLGQKERGSSLASKAFAIDPTRHFDYATMLSLEGRKQEAVAQLQQAVQSGYTNYIWFNVNIDLDPLRGDPNFEKLLADVIKS